MARSTGFSPAAPDYVRWRWPTPRPVNTKTLWPLETTRSSRPSPFRSWAWIAVADRTAAVQRWSVTSAVGARYVICTFHHVHCSLHREDRRHALPLPQEIRQTVFADCQGASVRSALPDAARAVNSGPPHTVPESAGHYPMRRKRRRPSRPAPAIVDGALLGRRSARLSELAATWSSCVRRLIPTTFRATLPDSTQSPNTGPST